MAAGEAFTSAQRLQIDRAIRDAEMVCRFEFSVFVGASEGEPRAYAERLHAALVAPSHSILILVDPVARAIEVVTGAEVRRRLDDNAVRLAVVEMQSQFAVDDLASSARKPRTLHA